MREAFALQKLLHFFNKKYWCSVDINVWNFNKMLTNDVVSFKQPGPFLFLLKKKEKNSRTAHNIYTLTISDRIFFKVGLVDNVFQSEMTFFHKIFSS